MAVEVAAAAAAVAVVVVVVAVAVVAVVVVAAVVAVVVIAADAVDVVAVVFDACVALEFAYLVVFKLCVAAPRGVAGVVEGSHVIQLKINKYFYEKRLLLSFITGWETLNLCNHRLSSLNYQCPSIFCEDSKEPWDEKVNNQALHTNNYFKRRLSILTNNTAAAAAADAISGGFLFALRAARMTTPCDGRGKRRRQERISVRAALGNT
ncbi:hypothetical protein AGLY_002250 [Aphis glycines]|uniref:Uncharacterized protein n=1 Tax=Aphis glycines TaxID=307491 RepID=A0A6G0U3U8_APHGL|nr:hypothetical protein AGLY_002250 [Aphis glycines]